MGKAMNSYLDFAENDYQYFRASYDSGIIGSPMAAMGQNICEKYLKHIISEYSQPCSDEEMHEKESILRTHSLRRLIKYIEEVMNLEISDDMETALERIDGFYFSTRYPGAESFIPNEKDISKANTAVKYTRNYAYDIIQKIEQEF